MGVSGAGKSTIGRQLATALGRPFVEGDTFHPPENIAKMQGGSPLQNEDRRNWITALGEATSSQSVAVVACSALNAQVRQWLIEAIGSSPIYIFLDVPRDVLTKRVAKRANHFFDPALLDSQLESLEVPDDAIHINADAPVKDVVAEIINALNEDG